MIVENNGKGTNITVQTLDAIMCHNGELPLGKYVPKKKTKEEFLEEYNKSYKEKDIIKNMRPMTLEGCVVRISDIIGYIGRDIEDAIRVGLIKRDQIPENITTLLGDNNSNMVNNIVKDIIKNSYNMPYIKISDDIFKSIVDLKKFNYENIYAKANTKKDIEKYELMFRFLFDKYLKDLNEENKKSSIYKVFLNYMDENYILNNTKKRIVIDFIAGMTDDYFNREYENLSK